MRLGGESMTKVFVILRLEREFFRSAVFSRVAVLE
jgi:hypothetical protein